MDTAAMKRREFVALLALGSLAVTRRSLAQANEPLCVIVAASSKQQNLSRGELRRIFLHLPTDDANGNRFIPLNAPPKAPNRVRFDYFLFGVDADEMARRWVDQRIRGTQAPRVIPTADVTRRVVAKLPGGIAYVPASMLMPGVKALQIDGRGPFDAGYPLAAVTGHRP